LQGDARHVGKPLVILVALQFGEPPRRISVRQRFTFAAGIPAGVALCAKVERPVPDVARVTKYLGQRRLRVRALGMLERDFPSSRLFNPVQTAPA